MKTTDLAFREGMGSALRKFGAETFEPLFRRRSKRPADGGTKHPVGWKEQGVAPKKVGNDTTSV